MKAFGVIILFYLTINFTSLTSCTRDYAEGPCSGDPVECPTHYWYYQDEKYFHCDQDDVFAFRTINKDEFTGELDKEVVESTYFRIGVDSRYNVILFKQTASQVQIETVIDKIKSHPSFHVELPAITEYPQRISWCGSWGIVLDQIMVIFNVDSIVDYSLADSLSEKYHLLEWHYPTVPSGYNPWFGFRMDPEGPDYLTSNSMELSAKIYENESDLIESVEPNMSEIFVQH